jgi:Yip1 domain
MSSAAHAEPAESRMSEIGRILGIFWDPKPAYRDLAAWPRWLIPFILLSLCSVVYLAVFSNVIGWETFMERQFEKNERMQQLTPEQRQAVLEQQLKFVGPIGYVGAVVGGLVMALMVAAAALFMFKTLGGANLTFKQAFSITYYSFLPNVLGAILAIVVIFFVNPVDFDVNNPLALNLGWFLDPETTPKWLVSAANSVDLFSLRALTFIVTLWVVWVLLKAGGTALFT